MSTGSRRLAIDLMAVAAGAAMLWAVSLRFEGASIPTAGAVILAYGGIRLAGWFAFLRPALVTRAPRRRTSAVARPELGAVPPAPEAHQPLHGSASRSG